MNIDQKLDNCVSPSPCARGNSSDAARTNLPPNKANNNSQPLKSQFSDSSSHAAAAFGAEGAPDAALEGRRCEFTFADGRRCRMQQARFCSHHSSRETRRKSAEAAPDAALEGLAGLCADLTTATNINRSIARTYRLLAQGRISQKQAVTFGYLSQLLLQTVPGIRAEYVSAFGYPSWESRLKESLTVNSNEGPEPSDGGGGGGEGQQPVRAENQQPMTSSSRGKSAWQSSGFSRIKKSGRQNGASLGESHSPRTSWSSGASRHAQSHQELSRVTKSTPLLSHQEDRLLNPDFGDLYDRSLAMLAGKYSTTPEGRRQERALVTELELLKPPASKPPRGVRAAVIEHMKRWIAKRKNPDVDPDLPPAVDFYGNPIKMRIGPAPWQQEEQTPVPAAGSAPACPDLSRLPLQGGARELRTASSSPAAPRPPAHSHRALRELTESHSPQQDACAPSQTPLRPHEGPHEGETIPRDADFPSRWPSAAANFGPPPPPDKDEDKDEKDSLKRVGHTTDWYAPASWSPLRHDPFPNRKEKMRRELRSTSNSRSRHVQQQNQSRSFSARVTDAE